MKPDTTTDYDPIPEGLEFDESYMQAAFELYDAEKKATKRRFIFWIWGIALGLTTGIALFLFVGSGSTATSDSKRTQPTVVGNTQKTESSKHQNIQKQLATNTHLSAQHQAKTTSSRVRHLVTNSRSAGEKEQQLPASFAKTVTTDDFASESGSAPRFIGKKGNRMLLVSPQSMPLVANSAEEKNKVLASTTYDSCDSVARSKAGPRKLDPTKQHQFFLNTGLNTLFGISELQSEFHLRESFGISYENKFAKRFSFTAHAELFALPSILYIQSLEGNSSDEQIVFTKTSLQFFTVSPKIDWTIGQRHHLAVGAGCDILLKNIGERYDSRSYTGDAKPLNEGYYQSFNRFNYFVSVGYGFNLSNRFALYGTYHFGLSDITNNVNGFNAIDRNSRFQLYLRMRVF